MQLIINDSEVDKRVFKKICALLGRTNIDRQLVSKKKFTVNQTISIVINHMEYRNISNNGLRKNILRYFLYTKSKGTLKEIVEATPNITNKRHSLLLYGYNKINDIIEFDKNLKESIMRINSFFV